MDSSVTPKSCFNVTSRRAISAVGLALSIALIACNTTPKNTDSNGTRKPWRSTNANAAALNTGYLSDQDWVVATSSYGPISKNLAYGEGNPADRKKIMLSGTSYEKGLGTHADSSVTFRLDPSCSSFKASIGLDDQVRWQTEHGNVLFQVYGDNDALLFNSQSVDRNTPTQDVDVNVSRQSSLKLVVDQNKNATEGDQSDWYDQADWGNARVECAGTSNPPPVIPPVASDQKSLIEIGWDAPTPDFLRANIKTMEQRPFNGLMVNLNAGKTIFNKTAYPESAYTQDRLDLAATASNKLNRNFITIWSAREADWNWFNDSDWTATQTNASNFAKTAKAGNFKGFFFDPEPYGTNPWSYNAQLYPNQSFASVRAKVRQRGAAFLSAIQTELPDVTILTLFGVSHIKAQAEEAGSLEKADWVLLADFIDGMLDVINPQAQLIDGHEGSYYLTAAQGFDAFRDFKKAARDYVSAENRTKYDNQVKIAHAVYVDGLLNLANSPSFFGYYLQNDLERQQMLEHNLYHALRTSDEYVWVYNENMDWWGGQGKGVQVPDGLESLLIRTAKKISTNQPLGFDVTEFVAKALVLFGGR